MADLDRDDIFLEYNPQPYQGGYDIRQVYGNPLPPSPSTCHPKSPNSSDTPSSAPHPPPPIRAPAPTDGDARGNGSPPPAPSLQMLGQYWFVGARRGPVMEPCDWAADYLFGYLSLFGPRRHESHNYGNLNYAYDRHNPSLPLSVEIDPNAAGSGWWSGDAEHHHEEHVFPGFHHPNEDGSVDPSWGEVVDHHDVDRYDEYLSSEILCGYERQRGCWESMATVQLEPVERVQSFEMDYTGNFLGQLFSQDEGEENGHDAWDSHEEAPIEPFVPAWSRDVRSRSFYEQHSYLQSENELEASIDSFQKNSEFWY